MSVHSSWRVAFAIVPVPILFFVAALTLVFGTDCPAGRWRDRHPLSSRAVIRDHESGNRHPPNLEVEDEKQYRDGSEIVKENGSSAVVETASDGKLSVILCQPSGVII